MTDLSDRQSRAWALLTARALSFEYLPGGHGGLTQAEVAGMLAGLDRRAFAAGMLCEAGEWTYLPRLARWLHGEALVFATNECWNLPHGPGQLVDLVHLALYEATCPTLPCTECAGTGKTAAPGHIARRSCDLCEGSGRVPRTQRSRADLIGISERQWHVVWKSRYRAVYGEFNNWLFEARGYMAKQLRKRRQAIA